MIDVAHFLGLRAVRRAGQAGAAAAHPGIFARPSRSIASAGHFSGVRIAALFAVLSAIASIPILLYPWPPLGDYINHLSRMHVIATINRDPDLALFYEVQWQVIPNLMMDLIVPILQRAMNVYLAGQVYTIMTFVLILSGTLALNRQLYGHWSVLPLIAFPLLYNSVFLVGTMNYLFGIGLALWALAAWVALRERAIVLRLGLSTLFVLALFFCHLYAVGVYGLGLLAFELQRLLALWERKRSRIEDAGERGSPALLDFVACGLPFLPVLPLMLMSPTWTLRGDYNWELHGKFNGLIFVIEVYSRSATVLLAAVVAVAAASTPPRIAVSSLRMGAARGRRRDLHGAPARAVRYLHGGPAPADRARLHDHRLRAPRPARRFRAPGLRRGAGRAAGRARLRSAERVARALTRDGVVQRVGPPHRARLESAGGVRRSRQRRQRARALARACRVPGDHRALRPGHDRLHRARQAGDACAPVLSRPRRHRGRHATVGEAAVADREPDRRRRAALLVALEPGLRLPLRSVHRCQLRQSRSYTARAALCRRAVRALPHQRPATGARDRSAGSGPLLRPVCPSRRASLGPVTAGARRGRLRGPVACGAPGPIERDEARRPDPRAHHGAGAIPGQVGASHPDGPLRSHLGLVANAQARTLHRATARATTTRHAPSEQPRRVGDRRAMMRTSESGH